jgi:two-component system sensor histidine kinase CiaH
MEKKSKKIRFILFLYWILLAYILAALVWWYIALTRQNHAMGELKKAGIAVNDTTRNAQFTAIEAAEKRKMAQYIGEGSIFLLLIGAGAIILFRAINKQLKLSREQQHFMMAITHELKTPIAVSRLNLETLQKRKLEDAQQQKLINSALQETNRMNDLCSNLLLSSQMEGGGYAITKEKINASDLLKNLVTAFKTRYPERKTTEHIEENIFIVADTFLLQMAINNLIDNANKYSPKDGLITIVMNREGEHVFINVIDEGNGIADEDKVKIFEKFYRTGSEANKKSKGTGLGLYLVQRIIRTHQGMVMVSDNKPKGSKFVIKLKTIAS